MFSFLLNKFGSGKLTVIAFFLGVSLTIPASLAVFELTVSQYRKQRIIQLEKSVEKQKQFLEIKEASNKSLLETLKVKDSSIILLQQGNREYAIQNMNLASSRVPIVERIIEKGNQVKQDAFKNGDTCAATIVSDSLRIYGNGSDYIPS